MWSGWSNKEKKNEVELDNSVEYSLFMSNCNGEMVANGKIKKQKVISM